MTVEVVYIVRHGYRSNWAVDPSTGAYSSSVRTPTGIPSDPALASYGVRQSEQLGTHLLALDPPANIIYSSPYYRCLQTLAPFMEKLAEKQNDSNSSVQVIIEPGLGEFYGAATFEHPSPAGVEELRTHFDFEIVQSADGTVIVPDKNGEGIPQLHDRVAYCLDRLIKRADRDSSAPKAILICTHAAAVIAMGRALTGRMPEDPGEEDFQCYTCGVSKFRRRAQPSQSSESEGERSEEWNPNQPSEIPDIGWREGNGVAGGWDCERNSDCSFLENGEERGWNFYMEAQRLQKLAEVAGEVADAAEAAKTLLAMASSSSSSSSSAGGQDNNTSDSA